MIFYEAPHKLVTTLEDMAEVFGSDRPISLCRELTKLHEEVIRTTLGEAISRYAENGPKGEFVLIVAGAEPEAEETATDADAATYLGKLIASGMSRKDAIKQTAKDLGLPKNVVYDLALKIPE
jgi:16S rRNA (cytidine1402-2'-O)-methyltransferase